MQTFVSGGQAAAPNALVHSQLIEEVESEDLD